MNKPRVGATSQNLRVRLKQFTDHPLSPREHKDHLTFLEDMIEAFEAQEQRLRKGRYTDQEAPSTPSPTTI